MKKYPFYTICMLVLLLVIFRGITQAVPANYTFDLYAVRMVGYLEIPEFEVLNITGEFNMSFWDINDEDPSNPFWFASLTDVLYTFEGQTFEGGSGEWKMMGDTPSPEDSWFGFDVEGLHYIQNNAYIWPPEQPDSKTMETDIFSGGILTVNLTDPDTGILESYSDGCQITIEKAGVLPVPEPSIILLLFSGLIGLAKLNWKVQR